MTANVGRCRWCGAEILWLTNDRTGKPAAVDPAPVPDGPIVRVGETGYHVLSRAERAFEEATRRDTPPVAWRERLVNHWQTCEKRADANSARRR